MIYDIFKTSIYHTSIYNQIYKNYFYDVLNKCLKEKKQVNKSNINGFQTPTFTFDTNNETEKKLVNELIVSPSLDFLKKFKIKKPFQLNNLYYWLNKNCTGSSNKPHSHGYNYISGVYYLKTPENSGNLVFLDINKLNNNNIQFFDNENFFSEFFIIPKENDLVLFFSETVHYVEPNNSNEDRISMAFNIKISEV